MRYYLNQLLINVAVKCLEKVQFRAAGNQVLHRDRLTLVKRMRQCI